MKKVLHDRRNLFVYSFLRILNKIAVRLHFRDIQVFGRENLPLDKPVLLISNHTTRWDPSVVQTLLDRRSNYMTSPNELRGIQGRMLPAVGSFPADPRFNLQAYVTQQLMKGEPVVVFPEGNLFTDGTTHPFKTGTAKITLNAASGGVDFALVPIAIRYIPGSQGQKEIVQIAIAPQIELQEYVAQQQNEPLDAARSLTNRMHREVCHLRHFLGASGDDATIFDGKPVRTWVRRVGVAS